MGTARTRRPKDLRAGAFQPAINSFTLHLNAEGKSPKTVRTYAEAAQWFAAEHLRRNTDHTDWDDVTTDDVRAWTVWLLNTYSDSYGQQPVPGAAAVLQVVVHRRRTAQPHGEAPSARRW
ncbi:hypothetical protein [Actinomadura sp. NTSP31]|uniref:hypothetical protein n=1 Tax=Actinomadura sp. NTSP31 TaxID=1735447 RepID=UPI0035BF6DC2